MLGTVVPPVVQVAVSDFNESARMTSEQIKSDLSEMSRITNFVTENEKRTSQTLQNSQNPNHSRKDESPNDDFEKVKKEFFHLILSLLHH